MQSASTNWRQELKEIIPLLGHRNWILIVDKAYPLSSSNGIAYLDSHESAIAVISQVTDLLKKEPHIKPVYYTDKELKYITNQMVPGADNFKRDLQKILKGNQTFELLHEEVFCKMDKASETFRIIVIKTENQIPYSSLFIELGCGYWSDENENKLRAAMPAINN